MTALAPLYAAAWTYESRPAGPATACSCATPPRRERAVAQADRLYAAAREDYVRAGTLPSFDDALGDRRDERRSRSSRSSCVLAGLMVARKLPALLAVPLMAIAMAAIAGNAPAAVADVVVSGAVQLAPVYATVIFGALLSRVVLSTGIAETIVTYAAEFGGDRPLVLALDAVRGGRVAVHVGDRARRDHHDRHDRAAGDDDGRRSAHDRGDAVPARVRARATSSTSRSGSSTATCSASTSRSCRATSTCSSRSTRWCCSCSRSCAGASTRDYATFAHRRQPPRKRARAVGAAHAGAAARALRRPARRRAGGVRRSPRSTACSSRGRATIAATLSAAWIRGRRRRRAGGDLDDGHRHAAASRRRRRPCRPR